MMIKRAFDILMSLIGLIVFGPLLLILAIWIKLDSRGPVFYRGRRAGRGGEPFRIMKFRSMCPNAESVGGPSTSGDDMRVTRAGRFLRKGKLDELPQLFNVFWGTMSFVGPRPEIVEEVEQYSDEWKKILSVRPGITDWASLWNVDEGEVLAGAENPHEAYRQLIQPTKLELQLKYCRKHSLWMDIRIILYTGIRILRSGWTPREIAEYPPPRKVSEISAALEKKE